MQLNYKFRFPWKKDEQDLHIDPSSNQNQSQDTPFSFEYLRFDTLEREREITLMVTSHHQSQI